VGENDPPQISDALPEAGRDVTRRQFIGRSATVAGGVAIVGVGGASLLDSAARAVAAVPSVLTSAQMATLTAALAQLFPTDSLGPGAVDLGVPAYIDGALAGSYHDLLPAYQSLLGMFDAAAQTLGASSFSGLTGAQQQQLLTKFESGTAPGVPSSEASTVAGLFQLLLEHMREGLFGDPMYGGNKGQAGWKMIDYPGIKIDWLPKDQQIGTRVPRTNKTAKSYGGKPYNGPPL